MSLFERALDSRYGRLFIDQASQSRIAVCATFLEAAEYYKDDLFRIDRPFALAVPSVHAPAWNVVLYPTNKGFREHFTLDSVDEYRWDRRHFTEDAVSESST